jgi:signal transduction histidine kinase
LIVITGSFFHSKTRYREFAFRYQLDKSRQELEESNRKLIELDQLKSRFFANVSHELRTPLTLLLAPLESLIQKYQSQFDPGGRDMLLTMQANGMRLLKLINDLLDLIRLESGRLQVKAEPIAVPEFINGLASAVRQLAVAKRITLEIHIDPELDVILGDHDKLEKIALNLLFNALKFTPHGGQIWLRVEKDGMEFLLIVSDNGMGIAEKSLPFVFDRFWQEDSSSKIPRRRHRPRARERAGGNPSRIRVRAKPGRQRRDLHRPAALLESRQARLRRARRRAGRQDRTGAQ